MPWDWDNERPIYLQLMDRIQQDIVAGTYKPGDKIPSVRDLALEAAVNPNTMQRALAQLEADGLVSTNRTAGRTVTEDSTSVEQVRQNLAEDKMELYVTGMATLGYTETEAANMLLNRRRGNE